MFRNCLKPNQLFLLACFAMGCVGCATKVRISTEGTAIFPLPINVAKVEASWRKINNGECDPDLLDEYNENVREAVEQILRKDWQSESKTTLLTNQGRLPVVFDSSGMRNFSRIDRLIIADSVDVRHGFERTVGRKGPGIPLVARIPWSEEDPLIPKSGLWVPITAVLEAKGGCLTMNWCDPTSPKACGCAANFTAPLARDLLERQKQMQRTKALINYEKFAPYMGINRVFDFERHKTPVVLVHGIFSNSTTWNNALNEFMGDPVIRSNYEFWTFSYPTGAPIPFLAKRLRDDVTEMVRFRKTNGACDSSVILIGHSMGGLMAKTLTQHSGAEQWDRLFNHTPIGELEVDEEERAALKSMFFFEPLPFIKHTVFTATPHEGTEWADAPPADLANSLIRLRNGPRRFVATASQGVRDMGQIMLNPLGVEAAREFPTSIEQMRYGSELGEIFADIPLNPRVCYYSIIGSEEGPNVPREDMTDGVVTYQSAHIDGVVSETIVKSDHGVHRSSEGIAELSRILKSILDCR